MTIIQKIKNWFLHSETIAWGRLQMFIGAVWAVLVVTDLSPLLSPKYMTLWLVISGGLTEYFRRRNSEVMTTVTASVDSAAPVVTKMLTPTAPPGP